MPVVPAVDILLLELRAIELAALVGAAAWALALGLVRFLRRPAEPRAGAATLDLPGEPPAVANLLVHDFRSTRAALPATLLDLAARGVVELEHRGPGEYVCLLRRDGAAGLSRYELRLLEVLRRSARGGIVPPGALTTGQAAESERWWRSFRREVAADCRRRGLCRDLWDRPTLTAFTVAGLLPAALAALAWGWRAGAGTAFGAAAIAGWLREGRRQRETPAGLAAASRWLGVRSALRENPELARAPAITVALWERHLAYAAAFGLADEAASLLGLGIEPDDHAWSEHGGRWRELRIRYPRWLPVGWGLHPAGALVRGLGVAAAGLAGLLLLRPSLEGALTLLALPPAVLLGAGALLAGRAVADLGSGGEVRGTIVRLRARESRGGVRHYVAVDDGAETSLRALHVRPALYAGLAQGHAVTASVTRRLRYVRSIAPDTAHEPAQPR